MGCVTMHFIVPLYTLRQRCHPTFGVLLINQNRLIICDSWPTIECFLLSWYHSRAQLCVFIIFSCWFALYITKRKLKKERKNELIDWATGIHCDKHYRSACKNTVHKYFPDQHCRLLSQPRFKTLDLFLYKHLNIHIPCPHVFHNASISQKSKHDNNIDLFRYARGLSH